MINLKPLVLETLEKVIKPTFYQYPQSFKKLPCISYYEVLNQPVGKADDKEYLSHIVFVVDVWGKKSSEVSDLAIKICGEMANVGFWREFSQDLYQEGGPERKIMRFAITK